MEEGKLDIITQISLDINEVKDLDILLERILTSARRFFDADAGSIYLCHGDELVFSYTQNDTLQKRLTPGKKLIYSRFRIPINNHSIAGYVAKNARAVNIPQVYAMSGSEPYTFDVSFDRLSHYTTSSMLTVPMTNQRDHVLGVMQIINAKARDGRIVSFSKADKSRIQHFATSAALALERAQMTRNIIMRMISMAELRDPRETGAHVNRVAAYSVEIFEEWAKRHGLSSLEIEIRRDNLRMAAMLHDVGKVAISDLILQKPGRLTRAEYEIIKSHTYLGARLFQDAHSEFDDLAAEVALDHHEKWDGTGYPGHIDPETGEPMGGRAGPDGKPHPKRGEEISLYGRIVAVADVYDALGSQRSYKEAWKEERILEEMHQGEGTHFEPEVLACFFSRLETLKSIADHYPEETADHDAFDRLPMF